MLKNFAAAQSKYFRIGVVGFSTKYFCPTASKEFLDDSVAKAIKEHNKERKKVSIVSGLTNIGVPELAYKLAEREKYHTVGYACPKCEKFECYEVDEKNIIGSDWGDESEQFLANIDVLIAVGGGEQTKEELKKAKELGIPTYSIELKVLNSYCLMGYLDTESAKTLRKEVGNVKGKDVFEPDHYHVTVRYWLADPTNKKAVKKVVDFIKDSLSAPVAFEVQWSGESDVWGNEKSCVLPVNSELLMRWQKQYDEKLQKLGVPPSTYPDYKPHITIGEGIAKSPKLKLDKPLIINKWKLTTSEDRDSDHRTIWESDRMLQANKQVLAFSNLLEADSVEDIIEFLLFKTKPEVVDMCAFDHFLLTFFSTLPEFHSRNDFSEAELKQFKANIPWSELGLDGVSVGQQIAPFRSLNKVLDHLVECLSPECKVRLAYKHMKDYWFNQVFEGDRERFVNSCKRSFWSPEQES